MANISIPVPMAALQGAFKSEMQNTTPAEMVAAAGQALVEAYQAYQDLKTLTGPLNGLADSAPIPESVKFDEIVIHFRLNGEPKIVKLHSVQRVGDLYRLLIQEAERLVSIMRTKAATAQNNAAVIETACSRSQLVANSRQGSGPA